MSRPRTFGNHAPARSRPRSSKLRSGKSNPRMPHTGLTSQSNVGVAGGDAARVSQMAVVAGFLSTPWLDASGPTAGGVQSGCGGAFASFAQFLGGGDGGVRFVKGSMTESRSTRVSVGAASVSHSPHAPRNLSQRRQRRTGFSDADNPSTFIRETKVPNLLWKHVEALADPVPQMDVVQRKGMSGEARELDRFGLSYFSLVWRGMRY